MNVSFFFRSEKAQQLAQAWLHWAKWWHTSRSGRNCCVCTATPGQDLCQVQAPLDKNMIRLWTFLLLLSNAFLGYNHSHSLHYGFGICTYLIRLTIEFCVSWMFQSGHEILVTMQGCQVTRRYLEREGFNYPIAVHDLDGLGLKLPPSSFSVSDVEHYVGTCVHCIYCLSENSSRECLASGALEQKRHN